MKPLKINEIVKAVGAISYTSQDRFEEVINVEFDSRKITPGSLFVPLKGTTDGHDYIQSAIDNGAKAAFWSRDFSEAPDNLTIIQVDDTLLALQDLAKYYLSVIDPKVVGITGSSGKTTTKDMTAAALQETYRVHKTQGNYNNEIGVPMTILEMAEDTQLLILEMGMSGFGEIEFLSKLAEPDVAVITMIGDSHMEHLGSRKGIAQAKFEITKGLKKNGTLIYPNNEPLLAELVQEHDEFQKITTGSTSDADVYAFNIQASMTNTRFNISLSPDLEMFIPVLGDFNVANALSACAVAYSLGVPMEQIQEPLANFKLTDGRMEWMTMKNGARILNDSYNANPTSVRTVIRAFQDIEKAPEEKQYLVLGDMLELGKDSEKYHRQLAEAINLDDVAGIFLYGPQMTNLADELKRTYNFDHVQWFDGDKTDLIEKIKLTLTASDYVLIKSSFGTDLLSVAHALAE